mgnify:CR=1 FL=1
MDFRYGSLFSDKQNTERFGSAMAGNSTAGGTFDHFFKMTILIDSIKNSLTAIVGHSGIGEEQQFTGQIFTAIQAVFYIVGKAFCVIATVFLHNAHFAVFDFNAGFQIQKVRTQSGCSGATASLDHVVQTIEKEAGFHTLSISLNICVELFQTLAVFCLLAGIHNDQSLTGGQILGIYDLYVVKFFCCQASILITGGESGTQADMEDSVILICSSFVPIIRLINQANAKVSNTLYP